MRAWRNDSDEQKSSDGSMLSPAEVAELAGLPGRPSTARSSAASLAPPASAAVFALSAPSSRPGRSEHASGRANPQGAMLLPPSAAASPAGGSFLAELREMRRAT
jgi:hypothetical protein